MEEQQEKARKAKELGNGLWQVDSKSTPGSKLCLALFEKYNKEERSKD